MENIWIFVLVGVVFTIVTAISGTLNSQNLQNNFISLGNMLGKSEQEIISKVGKPYSITHLGELGSSYYWHSENYQIALSFKDGKCTGIIQEVVKP